MSAGRKPRRSAACQTLSLIIRRKRRATRQAEPTHNDNDSTRIKLPRMASRARVALMKSWILNPNSYHQPFKTLTKTVRSSPRRVALELVVFLLSRVRAVITLCRHDNWLVFISHYAVTGPQSMHGRRHLWPTHTF